MCGIAGIYSHKSVAAELYDCIIHLQHRGQDAAGIMTYDDRMHKEKGMGLAKEVFNEKNMGNYVLATGDDEKFGPLVIAKLPFILPKINKKFWGSGCNS